MIEDVEEIEMEIERLPLGGVERLHHRKIQVAEVRTVQGALLQRTLRARLRIEEELACERRRAIGRYAARVRTDVRRSDPVRSIAGHEKTSGLVERIEIGRRVHRIVARSGAAVQGAAR